MFRWTRYAGAAMALALAAGCGGGDDDDGYVPPPTPKVTGAEGFWAGKASTGYDVALAILDNGDTWGVYARDGVIHGAVHGTTLSADGRLRGSGAQFDLAGNTVASRAYEGIYATQKDIQIGFGFDAFSASHVESGLARTASRIAEISTAPRRRTVVVLRGFGCMVRNRSRRVAGRGRTGRQCHRSTPGRNTGGNRRVASR